MTLTLLRLLATLVGMLCEHLGHPKVTLTLFRLLATLVDVLYEHCTIPSVMR